jgi:hypothetical protein
MLTPAFLPVFSPWIWRPFYWCGAIAMLLGAFIVDVAVLAIFLRHFRRAWRTYFYNTSWRGSEPRG